MLSITRPAYLDALVKHLPPGIAQFNKRCVRIEASQSNAERSILHFSDGTSDAADIVIGADGIKSTIRSAVTDNADKLPVFSNTRCFRGLIPMEEAQAAGWTEEFHGRPICFASKNRVRSSLLYCRTISLSLQHLIVFAMHGNTIVCQPCTLAYIEQLIAVFEDKRGGFLCRLHQANWPRVTPAHRALGAIGAPGRDVQSVRRMRAPGHGAAQMHQDTEQVVDPRRSATP